MKPSEPDAASSPSATSSPSAASQHSQSLPETNAPAGTEVSSKNGLAGATWFRRLVFWSVASAAATLVPVPLLDDHLVRVSRRRMVRDLVVDQELRCDEPWIRLLSGTQNQDAFGCLIGTAIGLTFRLLYKLLRRVFRTLFFWLAIKDASDAASRTFHEGYLLRAGLTEVPPGHQRSAEELAAIRQDVETVCRRVDTRPVQKAVKASLRGSWRLLRATGRALARRDRAASRGDRSAALEEAVPSRLVDRVSATLIAQVSYLEGLERVWHETRASHGRSDPTPTGDGEL